MIFKSIVNPLSSIAEFHILFNNILNAVGWNDDGKIGKIIN